jgi:RimJ/RimL family protein N-acetyltransferase
MIATDRLKLRPWRESDRLPFRMMCADPQVMEHLGGPQTAADADAGVDRYVAHQERHGHCFWAVERKADFAFIGFCGLKVCDVAGGTVEGEIEIGWRLRRDAWGHGFAKEAAYACFDWGFRNLECERIIALTTSANTRSWGLMDRLRMRRAPELDFTTANPPIDRLIVYTRSRGWAAGVRD